MKPVYANTFGLRKVTSPDGDIVEVTLDVSYKYMETSMTLSSGGVEAVSTPAADQVASLVMTRNSALALRNLLNATLGEE